MKTREQVVEALNKFIEYVGAETEEEHTKIAALLLSTGTAFATVGKMDDSDVDLCISMGRTAAADDSIVKSVATK